MTCRTQKVHTMSIVSILFCESYFVTSLRISFVVDLRRGKGILRHGGGGPLALLQYMGQIYNIMIN